MIVVVSGHFGHYVYVVVTVLYFRSYTICIKLFLLACMILADL